MADDSAPSATAPASPAAPGMAAVANTVLHYIAGGALLGLASYLATHDALDKAVLSALILAAAAAVGFKLGGK